MPGSSATRVSPGWISFGMPIFIVCVNLSLDGNGGDGDQNSCQCTEKKGEAQSDVERFQLEMLEAGRYLWQER
jgi:hypothetical protein